jgi:hypothetical protein
MKSEPANWINFLISLVPLVQTILWLALAIFLLYRFKGELRVVSQSIASLVSRGDRLKLGPIEFGISAARLAELRKLPEAPRAIADAPAIATRYDSGSEIPRNPLTVEEWTAYREGKYREARGFFLAHTLVPSSVPGQKYDVFITVNKYTSRKFADISISDVEVAGVLPGSSLGQPDIQRKT